MDRLDGMDGVDGMDGMDGMDAATCGPPKLLFNLSVVRLIIIKTKPFDTLSLKKRYCAIRVAALDDGTVSSFSWYQNSEAGSGGL